MGTGAGEEGADAAAVVVEGEGGDGDGDGEDVAAAGAADLTGAALGFRITSMTVAGTPALESRITSGAERANAVFELRI